MTLAPMVPLMGRHYLQLEFLLTKIVRECAISFNCGFGFSQIMASRLIKYYLNMVILQSQPLVRFQL